MKELQIQIPQDHIDIVPRATLHSPQEIKEDRRLSTASSLQDGNDSALRRKINEDIQVFIHVPDSQDGSSENNTPTKELSKKEKKAFDDIMDSYSCILSTVAKEGNNVSNSKGNSAPSSAPGTPRMNGPSDPNTPRGDGGQRKLSRARSYFFNNPQLDPGVENRSKNEDSSSSSPSKKIMSKRRALFSRWLKKPKNSLNLPKLSGVHVKLFREFYLSCFQDIISCERQKRQHRALQNPTAMSPMSSISPQHPHPYEDTIMEEPAPQIKQFLIGTAVLICQKFSQRRKLNAQEIETLSMADEVVFECIYRSPSVPNTHRDSLDHVSNLSITPSCSCRNLISTDSSTNSLKQHSV